MEEYVWDLESIFESASVWERELGELKEAASKDWDGLSEKKEEFINTSMSLREFFNQYFILSERIERLYVYAAHRHDEDTINGDSKERYEKAVMLYQNFQKDFSWVSPGILELPKETFFRFLKDDNLKKYRVFLNKLYDIKPHVLSAREEGIVALAAESMRAAASAFGAFNNSDTVFDDIEDKDGTMHPLTHGSYQVYLKSQDRKFRKEAFTTLSLHYKRYENTLTALLQGQVKNLHFEARIKKYSSCLEAALKPHNIDVKVYKNLIQSAKKGLAKLHEYTSLRKELMRVESLEYYDLYVPLVKDLDKKIPYNEARKIAVEVVEPLGEKYVETLRKGLYEDRWVDVYEAPHKRSGAYSGGMYSSRPFILLNYQERLNDLNTLVHEAGHSMHSFYSRQSQSYQDADYSIFVAEIASTFHEELLFEYLMGHAKTEKEKVFLINNKIEGIRATFYRQVMFAEFELKMHEAVESGIPLVASYLKEVYKSLVKEYYGNDLNVDDLVSVEYLRIPHFYSNYYVYQYATGLAAAQYFAKQIRENRGEGSKNYIKFISAGGSEYPVELLRQCGINMEHPKVVDNLIERFGELVDSLKISCKKNVGLV